MLRISTEEENYQDFKTPPRSPSNKSNLSLDDARNQDSLSRTHSLKSPSKRKNDLRSSAIIRYAFILSKLDTLQLNEYEAVPYFLKSIQELISDCLLISVFLPVFTSFCS